MDELTRTESRLSRETRSPRSPEELAPDLLCTLLRQKSDEIIDLWQKELRRLSWTRNLSDPVLKDDVHVILRSLRELLATETRLQRFTSSSSNRFEHIDPHILQRVEIGVELSQVVTELICLRESTEAIWADYFKNEIDRSLLDATIGQFVTRALQVAFDRILVIAAQRFNSVRNGFIAAIENILTTSFNEPLDVVLANILTVVRDQISETDTAAILLREGDKLVVRSAVGLEDEVWEKFSLKVGEGFSGMIAVERKPRMMSLATDDSLVKSEVLRKSGVKALYGVPLTVQTQGGSNLIGVAHIGSLTRSDFSEESRLLFRMIMSRVAMVLNQAILKENLDQEQNILKMLLENSPAIIFLKSLDSRYISINQRAVRELGFSHSEWIGRSDTEIFPKEIADAFIADDQWIIRYAQPMEKVELVNDSRGQAHQYLTVKFPVLDSHNRVVAVGGISTDITKRSQWENHQEILARIGAAIVSYTEVAKIYSDLTRISSSLFADCCIVDVVQGDGKIVRAEVEHRNKDKKTLALKLKAIPLDRSRAHLVQVVLASQEPVFMDEVPPEYLRTIAQGQEHLDLLESLNPGSMIQIPLMSHGNLFGAWVLARERGTPPFDRSDFLLAQEVGRLVSLRIDGIRSFDKARAAIQARDEILGVVAHDLRSPLGTIKMATELLSEAIDETKPDDRELIETITRAMQRMNGLIGDLLDVASLESGNFSIRMERIHPNELLNEIIRNYQNTISHAGLEFVLEVEDKLPDVHADRNRIQQVFSNLLDNAMKHTSPKGKITLGAKAEGIEVRFWVTDTGKGIPVQDQESVFHRFWQLKRSERRGVGLGLAICKSIIEAHGGRIGLESKPGLGSKFYFTLERIEPLH